MIEMQNDFGRFYSMNKKNADCRFSTQVTWETKVNMATSEFNTQLRLRVRSSVSDRNLRSLSGNRH